MRWLATLLLAAAAPAAAQSPYPPAFPQAPAPAPSPAVLAQSWDPLGPYISSGQDEPGYRSWYMSAPWRAASVQAFHNYLTDNGVGGVVPTWKLLRTATSWSRCGSDPFEVPPAAEWPHIVQTLRYIHHYVVPAVGPVEPVSGYRNPRLNHCAGGAPESAHKSYSAIDLVPLRPISREQLIRTLCAVHSTRGTDYGVGLGFYAFLRFHVDTTRFRRWGTAGHDHDCPPILRPADLASSAPDAPLQPVGPAVQAGTAQSLAQPPALPAAPDEQQLLAPQP